MYVRVASTVLETQPGNRYCCLYSNGQSVGEYTGDLAPDAIHAFIEELRGQVAAPHAMDKGKGQPPPPAYVWCGVHGRGGLLVGRGQVAKHSVPQA
jgi:hypothetical protein